MNYGVPQMQQSITAEGTRRAYNTIWTVVSRSACLLLLFHGAWMWLMLVADDVITVQRAFVIWLTRCWSECGCYWLLRIVRCCVIGRNPICWSRCLLLVTSKTLTSMNMHTCYVNKCYVPNLSKQVACILGWHIKYLNQNTTIYNVIS